MRAFARRDWSAHTHTKRIAAVNSPNAPALSDTLWRHMREIDPCWPDPAQRRSDLEHHLRLEALKQHINDVLFAR
jgi:hypothetical protein